MTRESSAPRIAVLLSGRGSNFVAVLDAIDRGDLEAEVSLVVSNVEGARGLEIARQHRLPTLCVSHQGLSRRAHEDQILEALAQQQSEWICLAGYMRLLSARFVEQYPQRILNIHPSLLPAFPGLHVHEQALEHGVKVSGCTVHLVDAGLDSGPIVRQTAVPVESSDDPSTLAARVLAAEHATYWRALQDLTTRRWAVHGRRLIFEPGEGEILGGRRDDAAGPDDQGSRAVAGRPC
jgi:phosphoribosylglycinamide formyltransferase-1